MLLSLSKFYAEDDGDDGPFGVAASWVCPRVPRGMLMRRVQAPRKQARGTREEARGREAEGPPDSALRSPTRAMAVTPLGRCGLPWTEVGRRRLRKRSCAAQRRRSGQLPRHLRGARALPLLLRPVLSDPLRPLRGRVRGALPRLQQRALVAGRDMGRVQDGLHALPMASSSAMSSSTSPVDFLPPHELSASVSASSPSPLSTTGYGVPRHVAVVALCALPVVRVVSVPAAAAVLSLVLSHSRPPQEPAGSGASTEPGEGLANAVCILNARTSRTAV